MMRETMHDVFYVLISFSYQNPTVLLIVLLTTKYISCRQKSTDELTGMKKQTTVNVEDIQQKKRRRHNYDCPKEKIFNKN